MHTLFAKERTSDVDYVMRLVEEGKVRPVIDRRYPLERTANALRYVREGHAQGKAVINVEQDT